MADKWYNLAGIIYKFSIPKAFNAFLHQIQSCLAFFINCYRLFLQQP